MSGIMKVALPLRLNLFTLCQKMESDLEAANRELMKLREEKNVSDVKFQRLKEVVDKDRQALFEVSAAARKTMEEQHHKKVELEDRLKLEREQRAKAEEGRGQLQQTLDTAVTRAVVAEGRHPFAQVFHDL